MGAAESVVTIGNFDGVHRGHQELLAAVTGAATATGRRSVVVTFDPHPMTVVRPQAAPEPLTTISRRRELLEACGVDVVHVVEFTTEVARMTAAQFVDDVLGAQLGAQQVVVGRDFRFGARGAGTADDLRQRFEVTVADDVLGDAQGAGRRWSSTWARELLVTGDVAGAAKVLGRPHEVIGEVVHGDHRGRELGYPTANVAAETLIPADGIYAGWLVQPNLPEGHPDGRLPAAISVGTNPTFAGADRRCEAYVLDRIDLDLYGHRVRVQFEHRLRGMVAFESVDALLAQMVVDVAQCRTLLAGQGGPLAR